MRGIERAVMRDEQESVEHVALESVKDLEWQERFREIYEGAVKAYQRDQREPEKMFSPEEQAFLASIGAKPQELYDFVEDWCEVGEPPFETVAEITAVRREYFLLVQQGKASPHVISMDSLPSMGASLGGFRWLPRIIAKAKAKLRGEMPSELMYGCGGDRPFLKKVRIHPAKFLQLMWEAGDDDQSILEHVRQSSQRVITA